MDNTAIPETEELGPIPIVSKPGREPDAVRKARINLPELRERYAVQREKLHPSRNGGNPDRIRIIIAESVKCRKRLHEAELTILEYRIPILLQGIEEAESVTGADETYEQALDVLRAELDIAQHRLGEIKAAEGV